MIDLYGLLKPLVFKVDPETAHGLTIKALSTGLAPHCARPADPRLKVSAFGLDFPNPVGIAADRQHPECARDMPDRRAYMARLVIDLQIADAIALELVHAPCARDGDICCRGGRLSET